MLLSFKSVYFLSLPTVFQLRYSNGICAILVVDYITIIHLLFGVSGSLLVQFRRWCSKLPLVQSLSIPLYLNLDRLIVNTIVLDRHYFMEKSCILWCHLDFYPKGLSRLCRSFVIRGCSAATGSTYVCDYEGAVPCVFNLHGCFFCFRFVEYTEVNFCLGYFSSCFLLSLANYCRD